MKLVYFLEYIEPNFFNILIVHERTHTVKLTKLKLLPNWTELNTSSKPLLNFLIFICKKLGSIEQNFKLNWICDELRTKKKFWFDSPSQYRISSIEFGLIRSEIIVKIIQMHQIHYIKSLKCNKTFEFSNSCLIRFGSVRSVENSRILLWGFSEHSKTSNLLL